MSRILLRQVLKLMALPLAGALAACGTTPPHSEYFVVSFLPGTPSPSAEGVDALGNAVADARGSHPREVVIEIAAPPPGGEPALDNARVAAIAKEFTLRGIDANTIHAEPRHVDNYAAEKDTVVVRLAYGKSLL
jgi:hypothetical protein